MWWSYTSPQGSTSVKFDAILVFTLSIQQPMMPIGKSSTPRAIAENKNKFLIRFLKMQATRSCTILTSSHSSLSLSPFSSGSLWLFLAFSGSLSLALSGCFWLYMALFGPPWLSLWLYVALSVNLFEIFAIGAEAAFLVACTNVFIYAYYAS